MSYQDGMAAINLEMPARIPRTEYSVESHWPLISRILGIEVNAHSPEEERNRASIAFMKAWNFDFRWSVLTGRGIFGDKCTSMGHAEYASEGTDFSAVQFELYDDPEDALAFDPWALYGKKEHSVLVEGYNRHYKETCAFFPDAVNMTGIYVTGISGMIDIFGWDMLLAAAGTDPAAFGDVMTRYADWISQYFQALADCDSPVVMIHDDIVWTSGAFIHPDWYRKYLFPAYKRLFAPLHEKGKKIIYTSDGTYTEFIDDIAACGVNGFVMEPTTDMAYVAEKYGKSHAIVGNADTRILLSGTREEIHGEVKRCMDIGRDCPGFFMAVGNHIPANTPVENCLYYNDCYEKMARR